MKTPDQCSHARGFYQFEGDTFCRDCDIVEEHATNMKTPDTPEEFKLQSGSPLDEQVGGNHYKEYAVQPVEFCELNSIPFCMANVIKYSIRHDTKDGLKDLMKAAHYCRLGFTLHGRKRSVGCNEPWVIHPNTFIESNGFDGLRAAIIRCVLDVYVFGPTRYLKAAELIGQLIEQEYPGEKVTAP